MRKISDKTRDVLLADSWMRKCCLCGSTPVQWHHNLIHAGVQCDEWWSILPLCDSCHDEANDRGVRRNLNRIMVARAGKEINKYNKVKSYV